MIVKVNSLEPDHICSFLYVPEMQPYVTVWWRPLVDDIYMLHEDASVDYMPLLVIARLEKALTIAIHYSRPVGLGYLHNLPPLIDIKWF
jgi:hypothetical protein